MENQNISLFIKLNDIKTSEQDIIQTKHNFYYIIGNGIVDTFNRGDIVQSSCGIYYCVYSCENIVPVDWEDIRVSTENLSNIKIHINRTGDTHKEIEGIVATPLKNYEWYDLGEYHLTYETLNRMMFVEGF